MRFHQDTATGNSIQSYSERGIVIDDKLITHSVLINPDTVRAWSPGCVADLSQEHFAEITALRPGIVILGSGATLIFPPAPFLVGLQNQGIGVEVMANDAAIRTFNVLLSEDRRVLLALLQA
ncbi:MAG: Mth938-like domain-containing protein [Gammaproteobacteria bacterium]|nr:Mth938-like domain-containing protein [Gammaproteobacteria bacterium]